MTEKGTTRARTIGDTFEELMLVLGMAMGFLSQTAMKAKLREALQSGQLSRDYISMLHDQLGAALDETKAEDKRRTPGRAKGGHARAMGLTKEQRSATARKAANARWGKK